MNLIPEWKSSWKFTSVQAGVLLGFFDACYVGDFFGLQDLIGLKWFGLFNAVVSTMVIPLLRNVQQAPVVPVEVKAEMIQQAKELPTSGPSKEGLSDAQKQNVRAYVDAEIARRLAELPSTDSDIHIVGRPR